MATYEPRRPGRDLITLRVAGEWSAADLEALSRSLAAIYDGFLSAQIAASEARR